MDEITNKSADKPVIVTVPCFSGAPWDLEKLEPLSGLPLRTMRLPEGLDDIEEYADFVELEVQGLDCYVLLGDSFGAVVSLAFATRRPPGLKALALSGGFAANPVRNPFLKLRIKAARLLPGPLYRKITLRLHASSLSSPFDEKGEVPWSREDIRRFFIENTPYRSYVARARAALNADYTERLEKIEVPVLIITPSFDRLIGREAASEMLDGIRDSREVVLERTGHMLRFTHPVRYAEAVKDFLVERSGGDISRECMNRYGTDSGIGRSQSS
jgi:pimeloyl-ACP methyl ester carboxylesterase